jgi:voltage-gated sodium channel
MKFLQLREACKNLRESRKFQFFVSIIIIYSSLVIGVDSYVNGKYIELLIVYSDYLITIIFLVELIIRFTAEKTIKDFLSDRWNIFDTIIVIASLVPSSASDSILVLRLLRLLRLLRIISFVPELRSVVENLIKSLSKSVYILVLIFLITYIYAVAGAQIFSDIEGSKFTNLGTSLLTLAQVATLSGWEDVMNPILIEKPLAWVYFVSYIFIVAIVILNLFIAILVDVVNPLSD